MATAMNYVDSPSPTASSGSPGAVSHPPITSIASITVQNITSMVPAKLNRQNYITWRSLFIPILKRFKLLGLVTSTDLCPPQFIWCERNQILMIWINSTLSEDLIPLTIGMEDSRSLWQSLERHFVGASRTYVHSLRSKIQTIQKSDSPMPDYLNSLKEIYDKLDAAGDPISESDLVAYTLSSLPDAYESFIYSIETQNDYVNTDELHGMLLSKEISLQKRKTKTSSSTTPFHAFTAQQGHFGFNYYRGQSRGRFQNHNRFNHNRNFGATQNCNTNASRGILGPEPGLSTKS
ncbi:unnamed protein product [Malus baccata var. baccata]